MKSEWEFTDERWHIPCGCYSQSFLTSVLHSKLSIFMTPYSFLLAAYICIYIYIFFSVELSSRDATGGKVQFTEYHLKCKTRSLHDPEMVLCITPTFQKSGRRQRYIFKFFLFHCHFSGLFHECLGKHCVMLNTTEILVFQVEKTLGRK